MNVLVANWQDRDNPQAGGAEIHLFEIFSRLAARGHRVRLVCSGWPGAAPRAMVEGIEVARTGTRHSFALLGRGAVRRAIRAERPDVIVEDINKLPLFLAGMTALPFCAIVPHLFGETAFEEAPWPMAATVWAAERPLASAYRRAWFHAISESTRDDLVARGVAPARVRVIHPGVDGARFTPAPDGRRADAPAFLYVGRLKRYKGIALAIRALALARGRRPELSLGIAGAGDHRPALERLAAELGLGGAVRFYGFVGEAEKIELMRRAWANLFPSPKEGWGITVVEAAACGTPSIASDSPGLRDSVRHGETGYLVPHGDVDALARRMLELAETPAQVAALGAGAARARRRLALAETPAQVAALGAGARRFAEGLTWERTAADTERHLHAIIAGSAGA